VRKLKDEITPAGEYKTVWNGTGNNGVSLPSGVYFIRLQANHSQQFIKAVLIK
jgi:flagellar hook assembly protein FlgD